MADLERKYIIPLRRGWLNVEKYRRTPRAVDEVKKFLKKHMKVKTVKMLKELNEELHKHGRKNPPHKVEVIARKVTEKDDEYVVVNLVNAPLDIKKKVDKKKKEVKEEKKETPKEELEKEKKEVLEHAEHPEPKEDKTQKAPKKFSPSPKAEKIVPQSGKK